MLFNSYEFLFAFLPLVLVAYFILNARVGAAAGKGLLVAASWFFYGWWNPLYLPLLFGSIAGNYTLSQGIARCSDAQQPLRKRLMILGVCFNLCLLGYFKYADFFIANANVLGANLPLLQLALPLAISFFSLQQIAYIVDTYRKVKSPGSLLDYCLFVSFFPQLIAGPIVHHREVVPQFRDPALAHHNYSNLCLGTFLFAIGLFKKVVLADTFAHWATTGFDHLDDPTVLEAWTASYSYTLQLYFDFSGYSDMALGLALMFNIRLPINFNGPYKTTSLIEFWRQWHITLSRFLREYLYIPLGGNRNGAVRRYINLLLTMVLAGIWHGAAWNFAIWGTLHGLGLCVNTLWQKLSFRLHPFVGWLLTFHFFSLSLVTFRAADFDRALHLYGAMLGLGSEAGEHVTRLYAGQDFWFFPFLTHWFDIPTLATGTAIALILAFIAVVTLAPSSNTLAERFKPDLQHLVATALLLLGGILMLSNPSEFIYFQF